MPEEKETSPTPNPDPQYSDNSVNSPSIPQNITWKIGRIILFMEVVFLMLVDLLLLIFLIIVGSHMAEIYYLILFAIIFFIFWGNLMLLYLPLNRPQIMHYVCLGAGVIYSGFGYVLVRSAFGDSLMTFAGFGMLLYFGLPAVFFWIGREKTQN